MYKPKKRFPDPFIPWSRLLTHAVLPPPWDALEFKLLLFLAHRFRNDGCYRGIHAVPMAEAEQFLKSTKKEILLAIKILFDHPIRIFFDRGDQLDRYGENPDNTVHVLSHHPVLAYYAGELQWSFSAHMADLLQVDNDLDHQHFGRVHLAVICQLTSLAACRLYTLGCWLKDSRRRRDFVPLLEDFQKFLGLGAPVRFDNFRRRNLEPALAEIAATGAFVGKIIADDGSVETWTPQVELVRDPGRGRKVAMIRLDFRGDGYVPHNDYTRAEAAALEVEFEKKRIKRLARVQESARKKAEAEVEQAEVTEDASADIIGDLLK